MPKRKSYSVREKLNLVTRIRNGESQCTVSRETSIAESTLRAWLKDEKKLRDYVDTLQDEDGMKRKKQRSAKDQVLDTATDDANTPDAAEDTTTPRPTAAEAVAGLQTVLRWAEGEDTDYLTIMQMYNLLRVARKAQLASRRQKKVTDFFTR